MFALFTLYEVYFPSFVCDLSKIDAVGQFDLCILLSVQMMFFFVTSDCSSYVL